MDLKHCTLQQLYGQRDLLIALSDDDWKRTVFYNERLEYINKLIALKQ